MTKPRQKRQSVGTRSVLGDKRRSDRAARIVEGLSRAPRASLPDAMRDAAALEAAYRFFSNPEVTPEALLEPHFAATAERVRSLRGSAYAIADSSELRLGGQCREGLGPMQNGGLGFFLHTTLVVPADGSRLPLGLLASETWTRSARKKKPARDTAARRSPDRESLRWSRNALDAERRLALPRKLIHVMDREADIYELLSALVRGEHRFVIRAGQDRALTEEAGRLFPALEKAPVQIRRQVPLSRRQWSTKQHAARFERQAKLEVTAKTLTICRPYTADLSLPPTLTLNFVHVHEPSPPEGETAVDWKLVTSEPIADGAALEAIIDAYRTRWVIEELFKALKTGCAMEESQLESYGALLNLLALKLPIAVDLLALRSQADLNGDALASGLFTPVRLQVLCATSQRPLRADPTIGEALWAVAGLGGHIRNNGPPGWQVLWRGFEDLLRFETGWIAAKCDQS